ncbi:MAG: cupin domain-containing protein [Holophagales bacterium]|nr:MAG: cupin domain-containing protein [Holophagales bacterium]
MSESGSRVVHWAPELWPELAVREYKSSGEGHCGVTRRLLVGEGDAGLASELRFFEVEAGGRTSFERHEHAHAVVVLAGRGHVRLGERREAIAPFDLVYVAPRTPHRFLADAGERLGFLCLVDRRRDRPEPVPEDGA